MRYPARLSPNEGSGFIVTFADIGEALTEGASRDNALVNAVEALEVALLGQMKDGADIPPPSKAKAGDEMIAVGARTAAKLAFYETFRSSGLSRAALARRIGKDEAEVRRMLDPYHATKLSALDDAIRAMGRRLSVELDPV